MAEHVDEIAKFIEGKVYNIEHSEIEREIKLKLMELMEEESEKFKKIHDALVVDWEVKPLKVKGMKKWLHEFGREGLENFDLKIFDSRDATKFRIETAPKIRKKGHKLPFSYQHWQTILFGRGFIEKKTNPLNTKNYLYRYTQEGAKYLKETTWGPVAETKPVEMDPNVEMKPVHEIPQRERPYTPTSSTESEEDNKWLENYIKGILKKDKGLTTADIFTAYRNRFGIAASSKSKGITKWRIFDTLDTLENVKKEIVFREGEYFLTE